MGFGGCGMLEGERVDRVYSIFEEEYEKGYNYGKRIGMAEARIEFFRLALRNKDEDLKEGIAPDEYKELLLYHEKYRGLTAEKMAERLVAESEFLHGMGLLRT